MSKQIKFVYSAFTPDIHSTLNDALTMFIEIETDMAMGALRDHTSKRSAVKEELVDQFASLFGMHDFEHYLADASQTDTNMVDGEVLLHLLRRYRNITQSGLGEVVTLEKADCISDYARELYNVTYLIERVKMWVDQANPSE